MTHCPFCKGLIERRVIEHVHRWKGELYILRNVQTEVCTQCGETFFAPEVLEAMDRIVESQPEPEESLTLPVFSL